MALVTPASDASGAFSQPYAMAGMGQVAYPPSIFPNPLPTTIAATSNWQSGIMFPDGYRNITVGVLSTQAGALNIQMYLDLAGTMARPVVTAAIVANTLLILDIPAIGLAATVPPEPQPPFLSMTVQITNTSVSIATISGFQMILSAG